jgi:hypothetical protein
MLGSKRTSVTITCRDYLERTHITITITIVMPTTLATELQSAHTTMAMKTKGIKTSMAEIARATTLSRVTYLSFRRR